MSSGPPHDSGEVRGLAGLARRQLLRAGPGPNDERELERLVAAQRRAAVYIQRKPYIWTAAALAAAASFVLILRVAGIGIPSFSELRPEHTLETSIKPVERYIFPDGTTVLLAKDAAIDVLRAEDPNPYIRIARGDVGIKVVHRPNTRWTFAAGPFEIEVVGTAFDVNWNPSSQDFTLDLRQGVVVLRGPLVDGPMRVRAGQRVSISLATRELSTVSRLQSGDLDGSTAAPTSSVRDVLDAGSQGDGTASAPPAIAALPDGSSLIAIPGDFVRADLTAQAKALPKSLSSGTGRSDSSVPLASASKLGRGRGHSATPTWSALVAQGRFDEVVAEARAQPIDVCFDTCSPSDLRALGDAARYLGQFGLAESAYSVIRRRVAKTADGTAAAFLLGRTKEAEKSWNEARSWYERYLAEAPAGEFAVEAESGRVRASAAR